MGKGKKLKIQTLIFSKRYYPTKMAIRNWLKKNPEYKLLKHKRKPILKTEDSFRVAQRESRFFRKSTFKTIKINKSGTIKAVVGKLR